ncbi:MAG: hypothetical protein EOP56_08180 [Sphingobacteriales bacterium]|nr:MAG: hypothetical protein EOP56_08180 [Sphingobacteriales bacterium]
MARTIAEIQDQMIAAVQADADLAGINSPSKRALWRLWTYVVAVAISVFEQMLDIARADFETIVSEAPPATSAWISNKMMEFQYDAVSPQNIQLINLVPKYPVVDESLRIITRCGVNLSAYNTVLVKVAKGAPLEALSETERLAAQGYIRSIGIAGIDYVVMSLPPDRLLIQADIYISGAVLGYVVGDMQVAIANYLSGIPFDGVMKIVDLIDTMKSLPGITDVVLKNVTARRAADDIAVSTYIVKDKRLLESKWQTHAGYMIPEDTPGQTLSETLTYTIQ